MVVSPRVLIPAASSIVIEVDVPFYVAELAVPDNMTAVDFESRIFSIEETTIRDGKARVVVRNNHGTDAQWFIFTLKGPPLPPPVIPEKNAGYRIDPIDVQPSQLGELIFPQIGGTSLRIREMRFFGDVEAFDVVSVQSGPPENRIEDFRDEGPGRRLSAAEFANIFWHLSVFRDKPMSIFVVNKQDVRRRIGFAFGGSLRGFKLDAFDSGGAT